MKQTNVEKALAKAAGKITRKNFPKTICQLKHTEDSARKARIKLEAETKKAAAKAHRKVDAEAKSAHKKIKSTFGCSAPSTGEKKSYANADKQLAVLARTAADPEVKAAAKRLLDEIKVSKKAGAASPKKASKRKASKKASKKTGKKATKKVAKKAGKRGGKKRAKKS